MHYFETCCEAEHAHKKVVIKVPKTSEKCGLRNEQGVGIRITGDSEGETEYGKVKNETAN